MHINIHCVYVDALNFVTSFIMHLCNLSLNQTTWPNVGQNAEKCDRICGNLRYICEFQHIRRIFRICDFENVIICGKICDLHFLPKYAIAYAIAYSHITNIPT